MREGDEDEEEPIQQDDEDPQMMEAPQQDFDPNAKHGKFVEDAMKQMQEDGGEAAPQKEEETGPSIKMGRIGRKNKAGKQEKAYTKQMKAESGLPKTSMGPGFSENDIEFMKKAIQILCQSTNPLGKSIDFVTDDIDSMSKEYEYWKKESSDCQLKLEEQQHITEEVIQPLHDQLADLEEKIREQQSKINSIKSSIMRNDITV